MNKKVRNIALVGILSALYVVASLSLKLPTGIGNISLDLGYVILTVSAVILGPLACLIGGIGAATSSILTSAYGFSISWTVMNAIIGLVLGTVCRKTKKFYFIIPTIIIAVGLGVCAKTIIECNLYSIPYLVKLPKAITAFTLDTIVMLFGLPIAVKCKKIVKVN